MRLLPLSLLLALLACAEKQPHADVFKPLDGKWRGEFKIYVDTRGQADGPARPVELDPEVWTRAPYELDKTLQVEHTYTSESAWFQRGVIRDTLPDGTVMESKAVNKVEGGKLWCLVDKPDDKVVHTGTVEDGGKTIIWQRTLEGPRKIEYFRETVDGDTYRIVGWGYYGDDDPAKAPRTYFYGLYKRVNE